MHSYFNVLFKYTMAWILKAMLHWAINSNDSKIARFFLDLYEIFGADSVNTLWINVHSVKNKLSFHFQGLERLNEVSWHEKIPRWFMTLKHQVYYQVTYSKTWKYPLNQGQKLTP